MRTVQTLAVVALVLLAGCLAPFGSAADSQGHLEQVDSPAPDADGPSVTVSATGTVTAAPDEAVVRFAVVRTADSAEAARAGLAADVATAREAIRDAGIPADAVETTSFGVFPVYDGDRPRTDDGAREPTGYRATHALAVIVPIDDAGATVDTVVGAGADEVYGVAFTLSDERRADLRSQAVENAVAAARADADAAAGAAGLSVDSVRTITVEDEGAVSPFLARAEAADAGGAATSFDPSPVSVRASVRVTYAAS